MRRPARIRLGSTMSIQGVTCVMRSASPPCAMTFARAPPGNSARRRVTSPSTSPTCPKTMPDCMLCEVFFPSAVGGAASQRIRRDPQARRDGAAEEGAFSRDTIEAGGRAKLDDDRRPAIELMGGERADHAVSSRLPGIIHQQRDANRRLMRDNNGLALQIILRKILKDGRERRRHAGHDNIADLP